MNRLTASKTLSFVFLWALLSASGISQTLTVQKKLPGNSVTGDIRLHKLESKIFDNTRNLRVLLPPGYDKNPASEYPVLYLNDGQNLFDAALSQFSRHEWKVDETFQNLLAGRKIAPLIIVGIDNAGKRARSNEYLPFPDKYLSPPIPNPQGKKYPDFLINEVMPFVEREYRIKKGAKNTGIGGSSYGALISLYTVIKKTGVFGRVLLESPSFYVSDGQILKDSMKITQTPFKVYLGVGTNEEGRKNCKPGDLSHEAVQDVLKLKKILEAKKMSRKQIKLVIEDCATHNEESYGRRFPAALEFLYGN